MKDKIIKAIARVEVSAGGEVESRGTGFLVTDDIVLTALHVVADRGQSPPYFYPGTISLNFPEHRTVGHIIKDCWDAAADFALLRCDVRPDAEPLKLALPSDDQAEWETWGFPVPNGLAMKGRIRAFVDNWNKLGVTVLQLYGEEAAAGQGAEVKGWSGAPLIVGGRAVALLRSALMNMRGRSEAGTQYATSLADIVRRCPAGYLPPLEEPEADVLSEFLRMYRDSLGQTNVRWDLNPLGGARVGTSAHQRPLQLDRMYMPLRLAQGYDLQNLGQGKVLKPKQLLKRRKPLLIRGMAGTGKTTWVRWTYRRLLEEDAAFPVLVELRKLAMSWRDPKARGRDRSLETFFADLLAENGLEEFQREFASILDKPPKGLKPVLLVDGWDELGPLGEELRDKLMSFMRAHPAVLVVVTSRPYGNSKPSTSENFEEFDIQPLSDEEVGAFAKQFYKATCSGDGGTAEESLKRFLEELERSPEAKQLARTALLLTMMLVVSRSGGLADTRHRLYEQCIDNLLTALPEQKESQGAMRAPEQFRPDDDTERFRVVAELAFKLQNTGYSSAPWDDSARRGADRAPVVRTWEEMEELLPLSWRGKRRGFLYWLTDRAGLLSDRADGTLTFTHLSFQEYLTAWHLDQTILDAEKRSEIFKLRMNDFKWWETLRLWAALVSERGPEHLELTLRMLTGAGHTGFWLAGTLLAEGLGDEAAAEAWVQKVNTVLGEGWDQAAEFSAVAWAGSAQAERRNAVADEIKAGARRATWVTRDRSERWLESASLAVKLPDPPDGSNTAELSQQRRRESGKPSPRQIAHLRIYFSSGESVISSYLEELPLLRLWPSYRPVAGERLQTLAGLDVSRDQLLAVARNVLKPPVWDEESRRFASACAYDLARHLPPDIAREWGRYLAHDWVRHSPFAWACNHILNLARGWGQGWMSAGPSAAGFGSRWHSLVCFGFNREWSREIARDWAVRLGVDEKNTVIANQFGCLEVAAFGRMTGRAVMEGMGMWGTVRKLVNAACELSLHPDAEPDEFMKLLKAYPKKEEPLWPSLCRYLARRPEPGDRELLERLARNPEKRKGNLRYALKYFVRGDVVLGDGTEVTLDELCDELNMPRLPYLEEMGEELAADLTRELRSRRARRYSSMIEDWGNDFY